MKIEKILRIEYVVDSQPSIVNIFNLLEQNARDKKLILYCTASEFILYRRGQTIADEPLLKTDVLREVMQFIEQA